MAIVRLRPSELKRALETGALTVHYQPQVEIKTGQLAGVEAFVRWPHPVHGMIGPSDIVPLVDQGGLHVEFDRWVIGEICRQAKTWRAAGVAVPIVAANVWSETLRRPDALFSTPSRRPTSTRGPSSWSVPADRPWIRS